MMEEWVCLKDDEPKMIVTVTESGCSNCFITKRWLTECFDPLTQNRAGTSRRLLFVDGLNSHTQIDFLEACWDRNIVCFILPAHLSGTSISSIPSNLHITSKSTITSSVWKLLESQKRSSTGGSNEHGLPQQIHASFGLLGRNRDFH